MATRAKSHTSTTNTRRLGCRMLRFATGSGPISSPAGWNRVNSSLPHLKSLLRFDCSALYRMTLPTGQCCPSQPIIAEKTNFIKRTLRSVPNGTTPIGQARALLSVPVPLHGIRNARSLPRSSSSSAARSVQSEAKRPPPRIAVNSSVIASAIPSTSLSKRKPRAA